MTDKPISPLRQRMINDMTVRNFVPDTQREYIRAVKNFTFSSSARPTRQRPRTCAPSSCT